MIAYLQTSPDAAVLSLVAGILLIYWECNRPGTIVPGCAGALMMLLSAGAFARMPLRPSALAFAGVGCVLLLVEVAVPARNAFAAAGTLLLILGLKTLLQPLAAGRVHTPTAVAAGGIFAGATLWLARIALRARRNKRSLSSLHPAPQRRTG